MRVVKKIVGALFFALIGLSSAVPATAELVLVEDGKSRAPIVIFADAPPLTRMAADELALYIEKTSGARPEIIEGRPEPLPERAIWVGYQPVLGELLPEIDFEFEHPEEILIAAGENHLVIAGRDRWDPDNLRVNLGRRTIDGVQQEYGTHNAVYTFLQDYLGVRWLWPGELGEDVLSMETVAFDPFEYRYHPQVRARGGLLPWAMVHHGIAGPGDPGNFGGGARSHYWLRAQRLQLCEWPSPHGHGFPGGIGQGSWFERFYETNPEYFALQPDGTRGGGENPFPSAGNIKMCHSNPDLAEQWLDDVAAQLKDNPNQRVFNASPADGWMAGHCVCENCLAWDHPEAEPRRYTWQGLSQEYVPLSDREIRFANRVARGLKERFPELELYVYMLAYGNALPPPLETVPEDNVIIGNVSNFLFRSDRLDVGAVRDPSLNRDQFAGWGKLTDLNFWRPNVGAPVGFQWGLPDIPLRRTMDDIRHVAEHGWVGIYIDFVREYWSTQGPLYYLMAQLTWNPDQDGEAILEDYYRRAFGPAASEMAAYWNYLEELREECYGTEVPGRRDHDVVDFYTPERLAVAQEKIDRARARASDSPEVYLRRIDFIQAGLDFTRLFIACGRLVRQIERGEDPDGEARAQVERNWQELRSLQEKHPGAIRWNLFFENWRADGPPRVRLRGGPPELLSP